MESFYTNERNVQMLISLMKAHGVKKVIVSPGATNVTFVGSLQQDPYFEMYSCVDERSAAYMACGLAAESGQAVALSCTGATASRNYIPGLTEAFYRKLPVLAITSTQHTGRIGQQVPQVIDRSVIAKDIARISVEIPSIHDEEDEWACNVKINTALLELWHHGGGPVHINLVTTYSNDFSVRKLPDVRTIHRICMKDIFPELRARNIGIFVGAHEKWNEELTNLVDTFCEFHNGVVFCDHTSNYQGKYRVQFNLVTGQSQYYSPYRNMDLLIDLGNVSGAYMFLDPVEVWRVNPDGEVRDTFKKLTTIFEMEELRFFEHYSSCKIEKKTENTYYEKCRDEFENISGNIPELPFSNVWLAQQTVSRLPNGSVLHLGILNSLRNWNYFRIPASVSCYANTGGFGIDGCVSSLIGASLANKDKLYFGVVGDLAFFYDLNAIGNHNVKSNVRLLLVNNGCGTEFRNYNHFAARFGEDANPYIAAEGHFGKQSIQLVKEYAEALGFTYLSAKNKEEYLQNLNYFVADENTGKPILFEVFTNPTDESKALELINHIVRDEQSTDSKVKKLAKNILGEKNVRTLRKIIKG